jgi:hypothetical protein
MAATKKLADGFWPSIIGKDLLHGNLGYGIRLYITMPSNWSRQTAW